MAYATRGGSSDPSERKRSETGPARCRRAPARASNVARSRTRQIRPRDACGRGRGGRAARRGLPWCACGGENRGSWCACDCSVGTCASTKSLLEAAARGPRSGTAREAETTKCTTPGTQPAQLRERSLGKTPATPCRTRMPVLRCAPRPAAAGRGALPRCVTAPPRPTRAPLLNDLHTCGRSCGQLLPGRRTRRSGLYQAGPLTGGRERTVSVDGQRHLGPGFGDAPRPARARHLGRLVPRRAPGQLRR